MRLRRNRKRIQECGEQRGSGADDHCQCHTRTHAQQDPRKGEQQQLFEEVDARYHENEQQNYWQRSHDFLVNRSGSGEPEQHGLQRQQAAGLQRITFQRHRKRENEFTEQQPASHHRPVLAAGVQDDRIENQETDDGAFVPRRRGAEEVVEERLKHEKRLAVGG